MRFSSTVFYDSHLAQITQRRYADGSAAFFVLDRRAVSLVMLHRLEDAERLVEQIESDQDSGVFTALQCAN